MFLHTCRFCKSISQKRSFKHDFSAVLDGLWSKISWKCVVWELILGMVHKSLLLRSTLFQLLLPYRVILDLLYPSAVAQKQKFAVIVGTADDVVKICLSCRLLLYWSFSCSLNYQWRLRFPPNSQITSRLILNV